MTGDDLATALMPARELGMFCPPRVQDDADNLTRMLGEKIGPLTIGPQAAYALSQTVAIMVMFPDAPGQTGAEILAESQERWGSAVIREKADRIAARHGVEAKETGLALLKRVMDPILREIGDRNVPEEANWQLVQAIGYIIAGALG